MKNIRQEVLTWVQVALVAGLWTLAIVVSTGKLSIGWEAVKAIPEAVTGYAVITLIFVKWVWRWPIFSGWLVPFPDLQGTWHGEIRTTWVDPQTGAAQAPIPATLTIRQSFASVTCTLYTSEAESESNSAAISETEEGGIVRLAYTYLSRPRATVRNRSEIHDGAALLSYGTSPERTLSGEYWTSRKTTGEMSFRYHSREIATGF